MQLGMNKIQYHSIELQAPGRASVDVDKELVPEDVCVSTDTSRPEFPTSRILSHQQTRLLPWTLTITQRHSLPRSVHCFHHLLNPSSQNRLFQVTQNPKDNRDIKLHHLSQVNCLANVAILWRLT